MAEVNASASMASARERFLLGLDRKLAEVVDIAARLTKPGVSLRTLDDLRRRLNALYASAKVFRVDGLTQVLADLVGRLESLDEVSAQHCVAELTRLRRQYGSGALTGGHVSDSVTLAAGAVFRNGETLSAEHAVHPDPASKKRGIGAGFTGTDGADLGGAEAREPGIESLAALESRSRKAFDALRAELGQRTVTDQQRRAASKWLDEGMRRVGASLAGTDVPKHWSVRPAATNAGRNPAATVPVGALGGLRVLVLGQIEKLSEVPGVLRSLDVEVVVATHVAEVREAFANAPFDAFVCGVGRRSDEGLELWAQLTECPLSQHAPGVMALSSETYRDRAIELGVKDAEFIVAKDAEQAAREVKAALERQVAPLTHLERALTRKGPVNGHLRAISPWQAIHRVARFRPNAKVVLRSAHSMFELDLREGVLMSASRTAIDGHYASGMGSLVAFLASQTGVFQVTEIATPVKAKFVEGTANSLQTAFAQLSALVLSFELGASLGGVRTIKLDEQALQALLKFSPPARKTLIQQLAAGAPPVTLVSEFVAAGAVRGALRDLLRHGALLELGATDVNRPQAEASASSSFNLGPQNSVDGSPRPPARSEDTRPSLTRNLRGLPPAGVQPTQVDSARRESGSKHSDALPGAPPRDNAAALAPEFKASRSVPGGTVHDASDPSEVSPAIAAMHDTDGTSGGGVDDFDASASLLPAATKRTRLAFWLLFVLAVFGGYWLYSSLERSVAPSLQQKAPQKRVVAPTVVEEKPSLALETQRMSAQLRFGGKADVTKIPETVGTSALAADQARLLLERPSGAMDADVGSDVQVRIGDRDLGALPLQVDLPQGRVHLVFLDKDTIVHRFMYLAGADVHLAQAPAVR